MDRAVGTGAVEEGTGTSAQLLGQSDDDALPSALPSSSIPSSTKNAMAESMSSTTMPTLSIRWIATGSAFFLVHPDQQAKAVP